MCRILFPIALALCLSACAPDARQQMLQGQWQGHALEVDGQAPKLAHISPQEIRLRFAGKGYEFAGFLGKAERGSYRLRHNNLYTKAEGRAEQRMAVEHLGPDTLILVMQQGEPPRALRLTLSKMAE